MFVIFRLLMVNFAVMFILVVFLFVFVLLILLVFVMMLMFFILFVLLLMGMRILIMVVMVMLFHAFHFFFYLCPVAHQFHQIKNSSFRITAFLQCLVHPLVRLAAHIDEQIAICNFQDILRTGLIAVHVHALFRQ